MRRIPARPVVVVSPAWTWRCTRCGAEGTAPDEASAFLFAQAHPCTTEGPS